MVGSQYNMKEYEYTYIRAMGILPSLEIPNSKDGLIYLTSDDKKNKLFQMAGSGVVLFRSCQL